jgi:hypothetical protein
MSILDAVIAIDPGAHGAIALLTGAPGPINVVATASMPLYSKEVSGKLRDRIDAAALRDEISFMHSIAPTARVLIEEVGAMPKNGVAGMFAFGYAAGLAEGVAVSFGCRISFVKPHVWKRVMKVPADKRGAAAVASQHFPGHEGRWRGLRGGLLDGVAEALLLAKYGLDHVK